MYIINGKKFEVIPLTNTNIIEDEIESITSKMDSLISRIHYTTPEFSKVNSEAIDKLIQAINIMNSIDVKDLKDIAEVKEPKTPPVKKIGEFVFSNNDDAKGFYDEVSAKILNDHIDNLSEVIDKIELEFAYKNRVIIRNVDLSDIDTFVEISKKYHRTNYSIM